MVFAQTVGIMLNETQTILDRLARKQAVERRKAGRSFVYSPLLTRETLRRLAVRELVESLFAGSEDELAGYLRRREPAAQLPASAHAAATLDPALL